MTTPRRLRIFAFLTLTAATVTVLAGCGSASERAATEAGAAPSAGYPVTVDSCGTAYEYDAAPRRVVLGYPRTLETLDALGVGDSVYGYALGSYDTLPADYPTNIAEVSPDYAPAREAVIAAGPDLFLANDEGQVLGEGTVGYDDLANIGAAVYVLGQYCVDAPAPTSIDRIYDDVADLGTIFGVSDEAERMIVDLKDRVATAAAKNPGDKLTVGYVNVYDGVIYVNGGYPGGAILDALGVTNEFASLSGNFIELTPEDALMRTPDVILVPYVGADNEQAAIDEVRAAMPTSPAVLNDRVYGVNETDYQAGGVSVITNVEDVAEILFGP